jgi:hypothetical protein
MPHKMFVAYENGPHGYLIAIPKAITAGEIFLQFVSDTALQYAIQCGIDRKNSIQPK